MIRRLRIKFIAIMMGVLFVVFATIFITLNIFMHKSSSNHMDRMLELVATQDGLDFSFHINHSEQDGSIDTTSMPIHDLIWSGHFFYVKLDDQGKQIETSHDLFASFSQEDAMQLALTVLDGGRERGTIDNFRYYAAPTDYGKIIVFEERSIEAQMLTRLITVSGWESVVTFLLLFAFSFYLSKWVTKPVQTAFDKQRRFISDASHELKTPLTILNANADVLENEIGANEHLSNIMKQSERINQLIQDLLALAKADEGNVKIIFSKFELSQTIRNTALEFESRVFEEGKTYEISIAEHLTYTGNQQQIQQLTAILIDNAIKHSCVQGQIKVTLEAESGKPVLSVYNTGSGIPATDRAKVFDRFYRSDESRARATGGYGLGLPIAKAIVDAHRGKISIVGVEGSWVRFVVRL